MSLQVLLHQGGVAILAAYGVVQTALVKVLLGNVQAAVCSRALDRRVFAVEHDMVVDVGTVMGPVAAGLGVGTLDHELVEHGLDDLGHGSNVLVGLDGASAGGACAAVWLRCPCVLEAFSAEVVVAGELDGLLKGRVADEADEIAVGGADVFERLELGGDFDGPAVSTLGGG